MKRTIAIVFATLLLGCMDTTGADDSVYPSTSIQSLHPAGMTISGPGSQDSACSSACNMLDECGLLDDMGLTMALCIEACAGGYMDEYLSCISTAADCIDLSYCFG